MDTLYVSGYPAIGGKGMMHASSLEQALLAVVCNTFEGILWDSSFARGNIPWLTDQERQAAGQTDIRVLNGVELAQHLREYEVVKVCYPVGEDRPGFLKMLYGKDNFALRPLERRLSTDRDTIYVARNPDELSYVVQHIQNRLH